VTRYDDARPVGLTIFLCFLASMIEGADIVSMGLAAPRIARQFGFGPGQMSLVLTATIVGLMIGAIVGGRAGDRVGRKRVIVVAFAILAIFSIATAHMSSLGGFITIRLLCGLGIGAAFPNLIALASEVSRDHRRSTGIGVMFSGTPLGGALLGLATFAKAASPDWTWIFYLGGIVPLLLLPALILLLPESRISEPQQPGLATAPSVSLSAELFRGGRWATTVALWIGFAATQILVYLLNNWLPTLMVARGFTLSQSSLISAFENFGAAAGCVVLAMAADRVRKQVLLGVIFALAAVGLASMATLTGLWPMLFAGIVTGFFVIGGQLVLYTLAPDIYPSRIRASGTGAAVSFGRLGGIAGPLLAGQLLAAGLSSGGVLLSAIPCALVAALAAAIATRGLGRTASASRQDSE
jgi:AAHS family 3-hydroxyphenylpropionic acid transporter